MGGGGRGVDGVEDGLLGGYIQQYMNLSALSKQMHVVQPDAWYTLLQRQEAYNTSVKG